MWILGDDNLEDSEKCEDIHFEGLVLPTYHLLVTNKVTFINLSASNENKTIFKTIL